MPNINFDFGGLVPQQPEPEQKPEQSQPKTIKPPKESWKRAAETSQYTDPRSYDNQQYYRLKQQFSIPSTLDDWFLTLALWFMLPMAFIVIGSTIEQAGANLTGVTIITLVGVIIGGFYLYCILMVYPSLFPGILFRLTLVGCALAAGVFFCVS